MGVVRKRSWFPHGIWCHLFVQSIQLEELSSSERWPDFHLDGLCTYAACTLLGRMFCMIRPSGKET